MMKKVKNMIISKKEASKILKKEIEKFYKLGGIKKVIPTKKMLKIAAADIRSRGSVAWGGKKARNVARFA